MKNRMKKGAALISNVAPMAFQKTLPVPISASSASSSQFLYNFSRAFSRSSGVNSRCAVPCPWLCPCPPWLCPWPPWLCPWPPWLCPCPELGPFWGGRSTISSSRISSSSIFAFAALEYLKAGFSEGSSWEWPWSPWAWTTGGPPSMAKIKMTTDRDIKDRILNVISIFFSSMFWDYYFSF